MIKNACRAAAALLLVAGCGQGQAAERESFQGVVELDERILAFEMGGRLDAVRVARGDEVKQGQVVAELDDSLEKVAREVRAADADASKSQVSLLKAGSRSEDIRAARAQVRGAEAREKLLRKNLSRERSLESRGVSTASAVDTLKSQLDAAVAEREALEQRVKALSRGARKQEIQSAEARANAAQHAVKLEDERLTRSSLQSPVGGVVLDVHADPGEVVGAGAPVLTVGDVTHPYADVFVPIDDIGGVKVNAPATIRVDSLQAPLRGTVEHVSEKTEFTPRYLFSERERHNLVVRVRIRIDDSHRVLHAGLPAFASIERSP